MATLAPLLNLTRTLRTGLDEVGVAPKMLGVGLEDGGVVLEMLGTCLEGGVVKLTIEGIDLDEASMALEIDKLGTVTERTDSTLEVIGDSQMGERNFCGKGNFFSGMTVLILLTLFGLTPQAALN